jgi:HTH-type transcriptional regulator / antitoxin HigA
MSASVNLTPAANHRGLSAGVDSKEYGRLLARSLPHVIETEAENEHYLHLLEQLDSLGDRATPAQRKLAELLTMIVEDFEDRNYALKPSSPLAALRELMRANRLRQRDLVDVFRTPSIVSEVIRGKRRLTTEHIRKLSQRFHVSPELFV